MEPEAQGLSTGAKWGIGIAALLVLGAMAGNDEDSGSGSSYKPSYSSYSDDNSSPSGFSNESDAELIDACMSGGSTYSDCKEIVVPLVRSQDGNDNGIADFDE